MSRKKRSDRNHVIYQITNTVTNERYIGVTVSVGRAFQKSVKQRWNRHLYKANVKEADFTFSKNIREYGESTFSLEVVEVIRGKVEAFKREAELINTVKPELNQRKRVA